MSLVDYPLPDISVYKAGSRGIDFLHEFDSGKDGSHVMISALIHGNETSGAVVLDHLLKSNIRPLNGKLSLLFANARAYQQFDPEQPFNSRYIGEDMNRLWGEQPPFRFNPTPEYERVQELLPIIENVDYLLDLHSMGDICPPLMMAGPSDKGLSLAKAIGFPEYIIQDAGHASGKRLRDYAPFIDPASAKNALLIESGQHWQQSTLDCAMETTYRFLRHFEMIDEETAAPYLVSERKPQHILKVTDVITVKEAAFFFDLPPTPLGCIKEKGSLIGKDGKTEILSPYDDCYMIMPQNGARRGQTAVRLAKKIS